MPNMETSSLCGALDACAVPEALQNWRRSLLLRVGGFDAAVDSLLQMASCILHGEATAHALLLKGPPGSGKTYLATVFAESVGVKQGLAGACPSMLHGQANREGVAIFRTNLSLSTARARQRAQGMLIQPTLEVLLLEGAEGLLEKSGEESTEEAQLCLKEVFVELLRQEMQMWYRERLPILLLVPWPESAASSLEFGPIGSVVLPVPLGWKQREAVLQVSLRNVELEETIVLMPWLVEITAGFLPSDLVALCRAAALTAAAGEGTSAKLRKSHFESARALVDPAAIRGTCAMKPQVLNLLKTASPGLDAVIGQDAAVLLLRSMVVQPFRCMQNEETCSTEPPIGILLSGCPGSGKTFLAAQLAAELSTHLFNASPADLLASRVGDAEKHLSSLFRSARGCAPSVIVLEDLENLAAGAGEVGEAESAPETCISYVLRQELDTIKARRQEHRELRAGVSYSPRASEALMLVVGTSTKIQHQLPSWLLAPYRFSTCLQLTPKLTEKDVLALMQRHLGNQATMFQPDEDVLESLCKVTYADVVAACRAASVTALRRVIHTERPSPNGRVELTSQWMASVRCAAFKAPLGSWEPSSADLDVALYSGLGAADSMNGTTDVEGIQVSEFAGEEFEVRCKVVGGSQIFGQGRVGVLRPVPSLMGCYTDRPADPDLPEDRGSQVQTVRPIRLYCGSAIPSSAPPKTMAGLHLMSAGSLTGREPWRADAGTQNRRSVVDLQDLQHRFLREQSAVTSAFVENVKALGEEVAALRTKAAMSIDVASRSEAMVKELWDRFPEAGHEVQILNSKFEALQTRMNVTLSSDKTGRLEEVKKAFEGQHAAHESKQNSMASRLEALECKVAGFMDAHDKQKQMLELQNTSHTEMASQVRAQAAHHAALAQRMTHAEGLMAEAGRKNSQEILALEKLVEQLQATRSPAQLSIEELRQSLASAEAQATQAAQQAALLAQQQGSWNLRLKTLEERNKDGGFVNSMQELQATIQGLREERDANFRSAEQRFGHLEQSMASLASEQSFQLQKFQRSFQEMQQQVASELNSRMAHHTAIDGRLGRMESSLRNSPDAQTGQQLEAVLKSIQELAIQLRDGKVQLDELQKVTAELRTRHEALKELSEADKAAKNSVDARLYRLEKAFSSQAQELQGFLCKAQELKGQDRAKESKGHRAPDLRLPTEATREGQGRNPSKDLRGDPLALTVAGKDTTTEWMDISPEHRSFFQNVTAVIMQDSAPSVSLPPLAPHSGMARLRGKCGCGDDYGQYGEQKPNITAGIPGCDCNGPYFAYHANCVWEQTSGRFGDETMLPLQTQSVTTTSAEMLAAVDKNTRIRCNVTAIGISTIPRTSAICSSRGCTLSMTNLAPSTTYTVSCEAEADVRHRSKRLATLLVRTLDPYVPPATPAPTRPPLDLTEPEYALQSSAAPILLSPHGDPPWTWLPFVAGAAACLSLFPSLQCCTSGKRSAVLASLELPHTFWLVWELVLVADAALGAVFLLDLLNSRYEREAPYWDELSLFQAAVLTYQAAIHGLAFLFFGFFPSAMRCLAHELGRDRPGHNWTLLRHKGRQHRTGVKSHKSSLPPELDAQQNPSALHYLPAASLLAVCQASDHDMQLVVPRKFGINSIHLFASAVQAACAAVYASHSWPMQASLGASIACMCTFVVMGIFASLAMLRVYQINKEGLVQLDARLEAQAIQSPGLRSASAGGSAPLPPRVGLQGPPSRGARPLGKAQGNGRT
ncbi:SPATA5L1 [Symbiodinium microadriaticum]|nr:SPATA5L1 [Symbiodinium microadriaticum]